MQQIRRYGSVAGLILALAAATGFVAAADFEQTKTISGDRLVLTNLVGEVTVTGGGAGGFEAVIRVQGQDASPDAISIEQSGSELRILPRSSDGRFVYPRLGAGSNTSFDLDDDGGDSWLGALLGGLFGGDRIKVSGSGRGTEIWADVELRVPRGAELRVRQGVGKIFAGDASGDLALEIRSGAVEVHDVSGKLLVDTGSGHVQVARVEGELLVDTGSGHVEVEDVRGPSVLIDTGSGHVSMERVDTQKLNVDTGSGHVEATAIATDSANIDTGSGSVTLVLDRMGTGSYRVDTGSGGVRLSIPRDASIDVTAETGSGGVEVDLEGAQMRRLDRDEASFTLGGGASRVVLDTGSGPIRIKYSD